MRIAKRILTAALPALLSAMAFGVPAHAFIDGLTGPAFNLTATTGFVFTSNATTGGVPNLLVWGYTSGGAEAQLPGPTLIVTQGQQVTIHLTNLLPEEVSIVVPGFKVATGTPLVFANGVRGAINSAVPAAAANGGTQTYTFTADRPGTFYYHSGTNQAFQVRMGLFGALIVRPAAAVSIAEVLPPGLNPATPAKTFTKSAYTPGNASDDSTAYDREFLYMVSEMDSFLNAFITDPARAVPPGFDLAIANNDYFFVNGRESFDIMLGPGDPQLPNQPYNCLPVFHPGERVLIRLINMGNLSHPIHTHGQHVRVIAKEGNVLTSSPTGVGVADLAHLDFSVNIQPGQTVDAIYTYTGVELGFDMYGHTSGAAPLQPYEPVGTHGRTFTSNEAAHAIPVDIAGVPIPDNAVLGTYAATVTLAQNLNTGALPVKLPGSLDVTAAMVGAFWGNSPFLGAPAPGVPGSPTGSPQDPFTTNLGFSYFFMWHSHKERELTTLGLFPGGMLTMAEIRPWSSPISATDQ